MAMHIALFLFGVYCILFNDEYIHSSKYIFVGLTGFAMFLNAFLLLPMKDLQKKILMVLSIILYLITVYGFWEPSILKEYWQVLMSGAMYVVLNGLFIRMIKEKRKWETLSFPFISLIVVSPIALSSHLAYLFLLSGVLLSVITVYLVIKISHA
jgi:hypothetical protein